MATQKLDDHIGWDSPKSEKLWKADPLKTPYLNPQNLGSYYLTWQKGPWRHDVEIILDYPGGLNLITQVRKMLWKKRGREDKMRIQLLWLALKMGEEPGARMLLPTELGMALGLQATRKWKLGSCNHQKLNLSTNSLNNKPILWHLDFSLIRPTVDFWPTEL